MIVIAASGRTELSESPEIRWSILRPTGMVDAEAKSTVYRMRYEDLPRGDHLLAIFDELQGLPVAFDVFVEA